MPNIYLFNVDTGNYHEAQRFISNLPNRALHFDVSISSIERDLRIGNYLTQKKAFLTIDKELWQEDNEFEPEVLDGATVILWPMPPSFHLLASPPLERVLQTDSMCINALKTKLQIVDDLSRETAIEQWKNLTLISRLEFFADFVQNDIGFLCLEELKGINPFLLNGPILAAAPDIEPDSDSDYESESDLDSDPDSASDPAPESASDPAPESASDPAPESASDSDPDSEADSDPDSEADSDLDLEADSVSDSDPDDDGDFYQNLQHRR